MTTLEPDTFSISCESDLPMPAVAAASGIRLEGRLRAHAALLAEIPTLVGPKAMFQAMGATMRELKALENERPSPTWAITLLSSARNDRF